jgi:predicted SnoaL-like aldol condensation-catalyzing enzyme
MVKTKKQIFQQFIDQVVNAHRFDMIHEYLDEQCIFHQPPYVGLGFMPDDTSGDKVIIRLIAPESPASEALQVGDEVVRVSDESGIRETYEQLKGSGWGQGTLGTPITLTVRRNGENIDVTISRARIEGFDSHLSDTLEMWKHYVLNTWPDQKSEINFLVEEGDLLAYFLTTTGTNTEYNQSAIWSESGILRFKDEKVIDWWSVEDSLSQFKQLGYQIKEPLKS